MNMRKLVVAICATASLFAATNSFADSINGGGTVINLTVAQAPCTAVIQIATLDLTPVPIPSNYAGGTISSAPGVSPVIVTCPVGTNYYVGVDAGAHWAQSGVARSLMNPVGPVYIPYTVFVGVGGVAGVIDTGDFVMPAVQSAPNYAGTTGAMPAIGPFPGTAAPDPYNIVVNAAVPASPSAGLYNDIVKVVAIF